MNYNPGQYFSWNGSLVRIENVFISDDIDHNVSYDCLRFIYTDPDYTCIKIHVSHDFILKFFNLIYSTSEEIIYE